MAPAQSRQWHDRCQCQLSKDTCPQTQTRIGTVHETQQLKGYLRHAFRNRRDPAKYTPQKRRGSASVCVMRLWTYTKRQRHPGGWCSPTPCCTAREPRTMPYTGMPGRGREAPAIRQDAKWRIECSWRLSVLVGSGWEAGCTVSIWLARASPKHAAAARSAIAGNVDPGIAVSVQVRHEWCTPNTRHKHHFLFTKCQK